MKADEGVGRGPGGPPHFVNELLTHHTSVASLKCIEKVGMWGGPPWLLGAVTADDAPVALRFERFG